MDALVAVGILLLPAIIFLVRQKRPSTEDVLMAFLGLWLGAAIASYVLMWLAGPEYAWVGMALVWGYAMYIAVRR